MTVTATTTDTKTDGRNCQAMANEPRPPHRQDRGRAPCRWFDAAVHRDGPGQSHGLTRGELKVGEGLLKDGCAGVNGRQGYTSQRTSGKP